MRTKLVLFGVLASCFVFSSMALAWTFQEDFDVLPGPPNWYWRTGDQGWMSLATDPDDPTNTLLHIESADKPDPWPDPLGSPESNRPQLRWQTEPVIWTAISDLGTTFECRFKQTLNKGGIFFEPYDGTYKLSFETITGALGGEYAGTYDHVIAFLGAGQYGNLAGPPSDFTDWTVFRGWMIDNEDGTVSAYVYLNGVEIFGLDDLEAETNANNYFRWGHSGGSGPPEGEWADIWVDYIYLDTQGAYPAGVPTTGETAVGQDTWGRIKSQF
jgi:hypothetical protein